MGPSFNWVGDAYAYRIPILNMEAYRRPTLATNYQRVADDRN